MKTKERMRLEIKGITEEGMFEGNLSPYGNVDGGGDVVEPGAYDQTLKLKGPTRPLLWQHRSAEPIGELTLESRKDGLWCTGQLLLADTTAQKAYLFIKAGIVKGLSIGFESVKDSIENGVRHLKEIKLYEGSIVTFPMNEMALITSVKHAGETKDDFNEELTDIQLSDAGYQMFYALCHSLGSLTWSSEMDKAQKVSAAGEYIQQFTDAYMAYLPDFLDMLAEQYGGMDMMAAKQKLETKAGAEFSAANKQTIKSRCDEIKSAVEAVLALLEDKAGDDTTVKAAGESTTLPTKAANSETEPVQDHSAITPLLSQLKESFKWNQSKSN